MSRRNGLHEMRKKNRLGTLHLLAKDVRFPHPFFLKNIAVGVDTRNCDCKYFVQIFFKASYENFIETKSIERLSSRSQCTIIIHHYLGTRRRQVYARKVEWASDRYRWLPHILGT